jgi:hypothetical protein
MGPIGSLETSVKNHFTPRNNPEDGIIQFNRGGSIRPQETEDWKRAGKGTCCLQGLFVEGEMMLKWICIMC